ncbi:2690_t:CDS:2 [Ambispora gerdemannii]|uniref:2690_t:CDS:1 n=1 Tax=Ambispora gerdemannii TaxID=144530 RepID=A0A9N8V923_9GLOM|nr:2690_t:CDS:2 [Ambispora gerdemannii]
MISGKSNRTELLCFRATDTYIPKSSIHSESPVCPQAQRDDPRGSSTLSPIEDHSDKESLQSKESLTHHEAESSCNTTGNDQNSELLCDTKTITIGNDQKTIVSCVLKNSYNFERAGYTDDVDSSDSESYSSESNSFDSESDSEDKPNLPIIRALQTPDYITM